MSECCMTIGEAFKSGIAFDIQNLVEKAYQYGYEAGYSKAENDYYAKTEDDRQLSYEFGLNMAWETASKLVSMDYKELNEVLSDHILTIDTVDEIFTRCTASEAIDKLRAYEEQKKQEDTEIHVGDEVELDEVKVIVTKIRGNYFDGVGYTGGVFSGRESRLWKKTGIHYDLDKILR